MGMKREAVQVCINVRLFLLLSSSFDLLLKKRNNHLIYAVSL